MAEADINEFITIKTVTNVDEKHILQFNIYSAKKRLWFPFAAMAFLIIVGIATLCNPTVDKFGGIALICIGFVMPALYWAVIMVMIKKNVKNSSLLKSGLTQTIRYGDKIYISENNKYVDSNCIEYSWAELLKAVETSNSFYLYIGNNQAFVVGKDCFIQGTAEELHNIIAEKLEPKKFIFNKKQITK